MKYIKSCIILFSNVGCEKYPDRQAGGHGVAILCASSKNPFILLFHMCILNPLLPVVNRKLTYNIEIISNIQLGSMCQAAVMSQRFYIIVSVSVLALVRYS
jgi:hypothetical protein